MLRSSANSVVGYHGTIIGSVDKLFERPWYTVHKVAYANKGEIKMQIASSTKNAVGNGQIDAEHLETA
jgi:hypothetical protein